MKVIIQVMKLGRDCIVENPLVLKFKEQDMNEEFVELVAEQLAAHIDDGNRRLELCEDVEQNGKTWAEAMFGDVFGVSLSEDKQTCVSHFDDGQMTISIL